MKQTIPSSFMALNTSFIISCGFDCDRIPRCHLAFFNDAAPEPLLPVVELIDFWLWDECWLGLFGLFELALFVRLLLSMGSNVTLKSFKAKF